MRGISSAWVALVVGVLIISGCSSSTSGKGTSSSTSSAASASSAPASSPSASEAITSAQAQAALVTPSDFGPVYGPKFSAGTYSPSDQSAPCSSGGPTLEAADPQTLRVGTTLLSGTLKAQFTEELFAYPDVAHAQQALAFLQAGVACKSGKLATTGGGSITLTFGAVQDVTSQLAPASKGVAVQASAPSTKIVLAAAQLGRLLLVFTYAADISTPDSALPNPIDVAAKAVQKVAKS